MEIKHGFKLGLGGADSVKRTHQRNVDLSGIPKVSAEQLDGCLRRSHKARAVHNDILKKVADGNGHFSRHDIEGMLQRAGVEKTDVKTVLAYHVHENPGCFDHGALQFLAKMDWSDVAADGYVDELKRQNKEQVQDFKRFIETDRTEHKQEVRDLEHTERKQDTRQKFEKTAEKKTELRQKTALEMEAEFAEETTKSGLAPSPKESFLLLAHRKRFANQD